MAGIYGYSREAVRVKVKKCEANVAPEWRKFSVDPQITSVEVLYSILAKAFDIRSDFSINYRAVDPTGHETFLAVLSDWDLDAAFLRTHNLSIQTGNEPCLNLRVDIKAFSEANDWEVNSPLTGGPKQEISPLQQSLGMGQKYVQNMQTKLPGLIMNHMEKTLSMVQRALNFAEEQIPLYPPRPPLSDTEFRGFLDSVGQILRPHELRKAIFLGGIDPSLRRVVWKHILNVYPTGMTGRDRMDYMKRKATEYFRLRDVWKAAVQQGPVNGELAYVTSMVRKDVLRTDRLHQFYAGSDDNQNIASLFNILTTYALNHPSVSYCQGMSDLASPLLVTMTDEAHAYICFCAIMSRLQANFMLDGIAMTLKFTHLAEALQYYDPEFYEYLKAQQADDLLFCYRWLLLELKREFPFEDSLRMLEVQWSSLRNEPPEKELSLYEKEFTPPKIDAQHNNTADDIQNQLLSTTLQSNNTVVMRKQRENHYTTVCALRRQSSSVSLQSGSPIYSDNLPYGGKLDGTKRLNQSLDENLSRRPIKNIVKSHQSLDETKMLMLMKNNVGAVFEMKSDSDSADEDDDEIVAEEKKVNVKNVTNHLNKTNQTESVTFDPNKISSKILFHPTNPFLDDALDDAFLNKDIEYLKPNILNVNVEEENDEICPKIDVKHGFNNISHKSVMKVPNNNNNNNHKNSSNIFSNNNTGNLMSKQISNKKGGHFKDLKDKIAASKKGILASLDLVESQFDNNSLKDLNQMKSQNHQNSNNIHNIHKKAPKVVKNFNEFLNFASINKNRVSDKLIQNSKVYTTTTNDSFQGTKNLESLETKKQHRPLIKLTKNSFDDSDSSTTNPPADPPATDYYNVEDAQSIGKPLQLQLTSVVGQTAQPSLDGSSPDDSQDYYPMTTSITRELRLEMENLDRQVFGQASLNERCNKLLNDNDVIYEKLDKTNNQLDLIDVKEEEIVQCPPEDTMIIMRKPEHKLFSGGGGTATPPNDPIKRISTCSSNNTDIFIWENPLHQISNTSSCNFNDINNRTNNITATTPTGSFNNYNNCDHTITMERNQTTPDEQQDLEYDGDIIIECTDGDERKKSCTPLRLIQQNHNKNPIKFTNDSDSDNTENTENTENSWQNSNNLNPFLHYCKHKNTLSNINLDDNNQTIITLNDNQSNTLAIGGGGDGGVDSSVSNLHDSITIMNPQIGEEAAETNVISFSKQNNCLPPPNSFGGGNPFLIFLCLTLLLQHRNIIIKSNMDYNEMAMHFDKMVRKHDVTRVLNQARRMYFDYLKTQNTIAITTAARLSGGNNAPTKS